MPTAATDTRWEIFSTVLSCRIQDYFASLGIPRTANAVMILKVIFGLSSFAATYSTLALTSLAPAPFFGMYVLHGMAHLFLLLNIGHDANHNALSQGPRVNRGLSYVMDLCGINSRVWRILHHRRHHYCINIHECDEAIDGRGLLRFSPQAPRRRYHRFQHFYALPAYCLVSLHWIFVKDFAYFLGRMGPEHAITRRSFDEYITFFLWKGFYILYMLGAPILLFGYSFPLVATAFFATHAIIGFFALLVFQATHALEDNAFPGGPGSFENYVQHVFATTVDCAPRNRLLNWLSGGLNTHVIHHLYPTICHSHYRALSEILRHTAEETGVPYRENSTVRTALVRHLGLLRQLGRDSLTKGQSSDVERSYNAGRLSAALRKDDLPNMSQTR
jgi:linoleoyl-CoA desaturase